MAKKIDLKTTIYTQFYDFEYSQQILREKSVENNQDKFDDLNKLCKKLIDNKINFASLNSGDRFELIKLDKYEKPKSDFISDQEKVIFSVEQRNDQYTVSTGLYCGVIYFGEKMPKLEITAGISDVFFKRILNYCCGIYADTSVSKNTSRNESIYSLLIQYLFLISLRKVASKSFPRRYYTKRDHDYNIKGEIDIEEYVNKDLLMFDKKVTYKYQTLCDIQNIIDVIYEAIKKCDISNNATELPEITSLKIYLQDKHSRKKTSNRIIKNILNEKVLMNSLYSDFKRPLQYAQILLAKQDLNYGNDSNYSGVSGYLIDASFLWEMYLYNLLRLNLPEWNINSQTVISFYEGTFYAKKNRPDLVLINKLDGRIFVFDAKFKSMRFDKRFDDVDNNDIRQLHAYSYYYDLNDKDKFCGCALIYPTQISYEDQVKNIDQMYSIGKAKAKFGVFAVKDPCDKKKIKDVENEFIKHIKIFIE